MSWTVHCDHLQESGFPDHRWPMVELDVVSRQLILGTGSPNSATPAEQAGGLVRHFLDARVTDWRATVEWAESEEAQGLLAQVSAHTSCDHLWSGDVVVRWSEEAGRAADALFERIGSRAIRAR